MQAEIDMNRKAFARDEAAGKNKSGFWYAYRGGVRSKTGYLIDRDCYWDVPPGAPQCALRMMETIFESGSRPQGHTRFDCRCASCFNWDIWLNDPHYASFGARYEEELSAELANEAAFVADEAAGRNTAPLFYVYNGGARVGDGYSVAAEAADAAESIQDDTLLACVFQSGRRIEHRCTCGVCGRKWRG